MALLIKQGHGVPLRLFIVSGKKEGRPNLGPLIYTTVEKSAGHEFQGISRI